MSNPLIPQSTYLLMSVQSIFSQLFRTYNHISFREN